ncbi:MAG: hypothetical protein U0Q12_02255 [Vicinamibacterales bacterium]
MPEKTSFAVRYHQALRFYPDDSVAGYEYPDMPPDVRRRLHAPPHVEATYK